MSDGDTWPSTFDSVRRYSVVLALWAILAGQAAIAQELGVYFGTGLPFLFEGSATALLIYALFPHLQATWTKAADVVNGWRAARSSP